MNEAERIRDLATQIAYAIRRKDTDALEQLLAPGFLFRKPGVEGRDADAFLDGVRQIPGEILFIKLVSLSVDVEGDSAVAIGVQHAQVRVEGTVVDDRRPFVDWFVKHRGEWRLRLAVDLPADREGT